MRGSALKFLVRLAIGAGLFAFLIVRYPRALDAVTEADPAWIAAGAAVLFVGIFVSALRWRAYLEALELALPFGTLIRLYFVGTFFNAFLPTGIGGDAYKAVQLSRGKESMAPAFASVFLDRFAGVIGLAIIGLVGVVWEIADGDPDLRVAGLAFGLCAAILVSALVLMVGGERLLGRGRLIKVEGIGGRLRRAVRAIHEAGRHPPAAARGYLFGLLFQALVLTYHLMLANAVTGVRGVSVGAMAGIVVISSLATMIPLTVNGLGFREGAYVWGLGVFGVAEDAALAFGVLVLAILLLTSAVGGLVYVVAGGGIRAQHPRAEG